MDKCLDAATFALLRFVSETISYCLLTDIVFAFPSHLTTQAFHLSIWLDKLILLSMFAECFRADQKLSHL